MFVVRFTMLCVVIIAVKNATERIPEHLRERFKFHILQLPKVVQEILKYVSCPGQLLIEWCWLPIIAQV